jgi:O-antigen ligase
MASGLIKAIAVSALAAAVLITSPLGDRIIKVIPFMGGTIDTYNIEYRHRLAERSLELVWNNPVFGDQHAYAKLHDLYQGVGVIDFVNVYADIAVFYGLFGLFVFVSFIMIGLIRVWRVTRKARSEEPDFALLGACISACVVGTLIMIYSGSFIFGYAILFYVLAGLAAAYVNIGRSPLSGRP